MVRNNIYTNLAYGMLHCFCLKIRKSKKGVVLNRLENTILKC